MKFDWNFNVQPLNEDCKLFLYPTIWYQMEQYGSWKWHSLHWGWFNVSFSVEVDFGK